MEGGGLQIRVNGVVFYDLTSSRGKSISFPTKQRMQLINCAGQAVACQSHPTLHDHRFDYIFGCERPSLPGFTEQKCFWRYPDERLGIGLGIAPHFCQAIVSLSSSPFYSLVSGWWLRLAREYFSPPASKNAAS